MYVYIYTQGFFRLCPDTFSKNFIQQYRVLFNKVYSFIDMYSNVMWFPLVAKYHQFFLSQQENIS